MLLSTGDIMQETQSIKNSRLKQEGIKLLFIAVGSFLYGIGTSAFIYPHRLLLGGTTGISVILNAFMPFSPAAILTALNYGLLFLALVILGKEAFLKNLLGSVLTTTSIAYFAGVFTEEDPPLDSLLGSAVIGAAIIALASALMFYVGASSGGTDIVALIVKKFVPNIHVGRALLLTDFLIVLVGGLLSGLAIGLCSLLGLVIKTGGIDLIIAAINKRNHPKE